MDYKKHYDLLITRSQGRLLEGYVEKHHIVPKCMGGTNDLTNIAVLTPEEHFVAHQLLVKIYPNNHKLAFALKMMCASHYHRRSNKLYGWIKKRANKAAKGPRKPRKKETKPRAKRTLSAEHRRKLGLARLGKKFPSISAKLTGNQHARKHY